MSKRREAYVKGIERLQDFLELFFPESIPPTRYELEQEIHAIHSLRSIPIEIIDEVETFRRQPREFFYIFHEHYNRFDDVLPQSLEILILPTEEDNSKTLQQKLTQRQTHSLF